MTTEKAKNVNYTDEMVETMRGAYTAAKSTDEREAVVLAMAETFGKTKRSIVSKMSREGFYVKKEAVSNVTGTKPAKKEDLAAELVEISGLNLVAPEKMNKTDLVVLIDYFKSVKADFETVVSE
jgi:hypothetical protein